MISSMVLRIAIFLAFRRYNFLRLSLGMDGVDSASFDNRGIMAVSLGLVAFSFDNRRLVAVLSTVAISSKNLGTGLAGAVGVRFARSSSIIFGAPGSSTPFPLSSVALCTTMCGGGRVLGMLVGCTLAPTGWLIIFLMKVSGSGICSTSDGCEALSVLDLVGNRDIQELSREPWACLDKGASSLIVDRLKSSDPAVEATEKACSFDRYSSP